MLKYLMIFFFLFNFLDGFSQYFVSTFSGNGSAGFINGSLDSAAFNSPFGLSIDKYDNLYIADAGNNCIRKIDAVTGIVTTLAGTGVAGWLDGPANLAKFNSPSDLCVDDSGNVYVSDFLNQRIRKIFADGEVTTIAGTGSAGLVNGDHTIAKFNYPRGICLDKSGNIYIADSWNHRIRKIDSLGIVSTYAGGGSAMGVGSTGALTDSNDVNARFFTPSGLSIDQYKNIFVADAYNHRIRKIDSAGVVTTYVGSGSTGVGNGGFMDGSKDVALLNTPTEVFIDTASNDLYISDTFNNRIRKANSYGDTVTTFAGSGLPSFVDSIDTLAAFNYPRGVVVSNLSTKIVYLNDYNNNAIRRIEYKNKLSLKDIMYDDNIVIYPNPSNAEFTVQLFKNDFNLINVLNIFGNNIKEVSINLEKTIYINLENFVKGVFFLKIQKKSGKFIVKKIYLQ